MKHNPGFLALVENVLPHITEIDIDTLRQNQQDLAPSWQIIDVREDHEWAKGQIPEAKHLGRGIIERDIETLFSDKNTPLALYCGGGFRSALSAFNLQAMGYTQVVSIAGGYKAWVAAKLPLVHE